MIRRFFVWLHRWAGLLMAAFIILVGVTGSVLAFTTELNQLVSPRFYAKPHPGAPRLDFFTLASRAEALVPEGQVYSITTTPGQVRVGFSPRNNPATGKPYKLDLEWLFLNPWTGEELARLKPGERDPEALTLTIVQLHEALCLGTIGLTFMGVLALLWTIDCFVGFYLTLPATIERFWPRWRQAWLVKWRASAARVNFDLHRASGLWLWPVLFVFAWSSVMFNLPAVYKPVTRAIFDYQLRDEGEMPMPGTGAERPPRLDLHAAILTARRLMTEQATTHHFSLGDETAFAYFSDSRTYFYNIHSSRDISDWDSFTTLTFDGDAGALRSVHIPTGEHSGDTVSLWLQYLHETGVFGLPYRIFVCVLGLLIAMLSYTGVYIWWRKRQGRILAARKQQASFTKAVVQTEGGTP